LHREVWFHSAGCRKFFNVVRDTQTYEIHESYLIGTQPAGSGTSDSDSTEVQAS
jgi:sarcosine oxidase subunit delta